MPRKEVAHRAPPAVTCADKMRGLSRFTELWSLNRDLPGFGDSMPNSRAKSILLPLLSVAKSLKVPGSLSLSGRTADAPGWMFCRKGFRNPLNQSLLLEHGQADSAL